MTIDGCFSVQSLARLFLNILMLTGGEQGIEGTVYVLGPEQAKAQKREETAIEEETTAGREEATDKLCPGHLLNRPEGTGDLQHAEPGFGLLNVDVKRK